MPPISHLHVSKLWNRKSSVEDARLQRDEKKVKLEDIYEKLFNIPEPIRKYRLVNSWAPWAIYVPYRVYEAITRDSRYMRSRWADQPRKRPGRTAPRLPQTYSYQPLESTESIRLLTILPGSPEDLISCSLTHHDLGHPPEYWAISYSWLSDSGADYLRCGSHNLAVQRTIHQLLMRLRKPEESITLWIDAICINQSDIREQNSQVEMMGRIYHSADNVVVWVGEEDDRTERLDKFVKCVPDIAAGEATLPWRMAPEWTDLALFLDRPWFTRTWVLQEVCSARSCVVRCGSYIWRWRDLQDAFGRIQDVIAVDTMGVRERFRGSAVEFYDGWGSLDQRKLLDLLATSRGTFASRPADKVYAVLPLAADRLGIKVDYRRSVQELYKEVSGLLLRSGDLGALQDAGDSVWNNVQGLPSWVKDWSCSEEPRSLSNLSYPSMASTSGARNSASVFKTEKKTQISEDGNLVRLQAFEIDRVRASGTPWPGNKRITNPFIPDLDVWELGSLALSRLKDWHSMLWRPGKDGKRPYVVTGETITGAFMKTLVVGDLELPQDCQTWEQVYPLYKARLRYLMRRGTFGFHSEMINPSDDLDRYHMAVMSWCSKRTFFLTKKGCMGLGPFFTLPFDRIFLIAGERCPAVMRRTLRGKYKLIGLCYIHGFEKVVDSWLLGQEPQYITIE